MVAKYSTFVPYMYREIVQYRALDFNHGCKLGTGISLHSYYWQNTHSRFRLLPKGRPYLVGTMLFPQKNGGMLRPSIGDASLREI
ncbi:MAG: hypothetical protein HW389_2202 [Bacteroidetes bacterium]|nr:hypothetical protein [Bacteroidota bacterium]MBM2845327.1 hypothetical protein [Bacteroidota bacterium]